MAHYEIIQTETGHSFGVYAGETPDAAIAAMLADAGHDGEADPGLRAVDVSYEAAARHGAYDVEGTTKHGSRADAEAAARKAAKVAGHGWTPVIRQHIDATSYTSWEQVAEVAPLDADAIAETAAMHVADVIRMGALTAADLAAEPTDDALDSWHRSDILAAAGLPRDASDADLDRARAALAQAIREAAEARVE